MELDFSADQEALRTSVRDVLARACPIDLVRGIVERRDGATADGLWKQLVQLDWPALTIAEAQGGIGLGFVDLAVVLEELGRVLAPGPFVPTMTQLVPVVREAGDDEQSERILARVATGDITGTLALAETAGWDLASVTTVIGPAGDAWTVEGDKRFVMEAGTADEVVVVGRLPGTSGDDGITLALVPAEELTIVPLPSLDQSRELASVDIAGVRVGRDRILGEPGGAAAALTRAVEEATVAVALELVGTCQSIFDITLDHAKTREQFGAPIGSFQAVKHKLADMFVALERARATCYFAAATIAEDDPRRALAASMAKAAAGDCQRVVAQDGIQLLGGIGYTWEHDMQLYVKRAKVSDGLFGGAAAHRSRVADLIGLDRR